MPAHPLEPDRAAMEAMAAAATGVVTAFVEGLPTPAAGTEGAGPLVGPLLAPPPEGPGDVTAARPVPAGGRPCDRDGRARLPGLRGRRRPLLLGPGRVRGPGLQPLHGPGRLRPRAGGHGGGHPALAGRRDGAAGGSAGIVSTGGSLATLTALVAARVDRLGDDIGTGTVYVTEYTHRCVAKAARVAGLRPDQVRVVRSGPDLRMDPAAAAGMIEATGPRVAGRSCWWARPGPRTPAPSIPWVTWPRWPGRRTCGSTSTAPTAGCSG